MLQLIILFIDADDPIEIWLIGLLVKLGHGAESRATEKEVELFVEVAITLFRSLGISQELRWLAVLCWHHRLLLLFSNDFFGLFC